MGIAKFLQQVFDEKTNDNAQSLTGAQDASFVVEKSIRPRFQLALFREHANLINNTLTVLLANEIKHPKQDYVCLYHSHNIYDPALEKTLYVAITANDTRNTNTSMVAITATSHFGPVLLFVASIAVIDFMFGNNVSMVAPNILMFCLTSSRMLSH